MTSFLLFLDNIEKIQEKIKLSFEYFWKYYEKLKISFSIIFSKTWYFKGVQKCYYGVKG